MSKPSGNGDERIGNLGLAAYLKMKGCRVTGRTGNLVFFERNEENDSKAIDKHKIDYVNSMFAEFDGWLMTMKNMPQESVDVVNPAIQEINSLGLATYIKMKSNWRLVGRTAPSRFVFMVPIDDKHKFNQLQYEWANHELRNFDAAMMSLKAIRLRR